jgi:hypothetical protein
VKLRLAGLGFALLLAGCATSQSRPLDTRPAWACGSRTDRNGLDLTAIRTLDAQGRQLDADVQWSIGGFDGGRLSLMATQHIKGAGDPPAQPPELLVSWSGFSDRLQRDRLLIVLHASDKPPNALDGVAMIPYVNGLIGAVISWQRVRTLARNSPSALLTLLDPRGHAIRSAPVGLKKLGTIADQTRAALDETRAKAASFRKRCQPVTEWMRL